MKFQPTKPNGGFIRSIKVEKQPESEPELQKSIVYVASIVFDVRNDVTSLTAR
jgi:hypothetical protein